MNEEETIKESIIFFALGLISLIIGLISIIIGMYLWLKFPNNISHCFCIYYGGQFIGMGREILKNE